MQHWFPKINIKQFKYYVLFLAMGVSCFSKAMKKKIENDYTIEKNPVYEKIISNQVITKGISIIVDYFDKESVTYVRELRNIEQKKNDHTIYVTCQKMITSRKYDILHEIEIINDMCIFCKTLINAKIHMNDDPLFSVLIKRYSSYGKYLSKNNMIVEQDFFTPGKQEKQLKELFSAMVSKGALITQEVLNVAEQEDNKHLVDILKDFLSKN